MSPKEALAKHSRASVKRRVFARSATDGFWLDSSLRIGPSWPVARRLLEFRDSLYAPITPKRFCQPRARPRHCSVLLVGLFDHSAIRLFVGSSLSLDTENFDFANPNLMFIHRLEGDRTTPRTVGGHPHCGGLATIDAHSQIPVMGDESESEPFIVTNQWRLHIGP